MYSLELTNQIKRHGTYSGTTWHFKKCFSSPHTATIPCWTQQLSPREALNPNLSMTDPDVPRTSNDCLYESLSAGLYYGAQSSVISGSLYFAAMRFSPFFQRSFTPSARTGGCMQVAKASVLTPAHISTETLSAHGACLACSPDADAHLLHVMAARGAVNAQVCYGGDRADRSNLHCFKCLHGRMHTLALLCVWKSVWEAAASCSRGMLDYCRGKIKRPALTICSRFHKGWRHFSDRGT